ncbi:hypothetical protein [Solitalea lacus]|uniref:hypothetical protein n=1 Tax=Solitalea lacus TaxID=2911172 RepID=UPI001EDC029A|nr:hypothetical protein [Solitalea lacus]UKJ06184.1 hypothetical protein L2B55_11610 [Solitalea lacus]
MDILKKQLKPNWSFSLSILLLLFLLSLCSNAQTNDSTNLTPKKKIDGYQDAVATGLVGDILYKVISREGKSKTYTDLIPLDGGTVGIAHFAVGGLADLYRQMDTEKYFGKSQQEMIANYSSKCRPSGKSGNDNGWGCYSQTWWREGFKKFLASEESKRIQDKVWAMKMKEVIDIAISKGWNSQRQIAIALGIANSRGTSGFIKMADNNSWDAEKTLSTYAKKSDHTKRRKEAIDKFFPK